MSSSNSINPTSKRTVVEEGTHFTGNLTSTCPIDVRGRVEGDVQAPSLTVSARGAVHGHAKVGSVHSEGELSGEFEAETVELSGTVKDKTVIRARSLEVRLSSAKGQQVIFGDCELSVGAEPTEYDVIEEPAAAATAALPVQDELPPVAPAYVEPAPEPVAEAHSEPSEPALDAGAAAAPEEAQDEASAVSAEADGADEDKPVANSIEEALASEAEAPDAKAKGKGKSKGGKRKENGADASSGWSQPPSQPPPAE